MENERITAYKLRKLKNIITVVALAIIVLGAAWQICSRHGIKLSSIFQIDENEAIVKTEKKNFDTEDLTSPYVNGKTAEDFPNSVSDKCTVTENSNTGIKLSDVYYVVDTDNNLEQIRFRYAIADKSSKINLLVRGQISIQSEEGDNMLGIFSALTDNYGPYRSQIVTVNLADTKYQHAEGKHFKLGLEVDTTDIKAEYDILVPEKEEEMTSDESLSMKLGFNSYGINSAYTVGDDNNIAINAITSACPTTVLKADGIKISDIYYIYDENNQIEQIRFRYGLEDTSFETDLSRTGKVSLFDSMNNQLIGLFSTQTDNFGQYCSQIVNINLSESGYSGATGTQFRVVVSVDGTVYSAEFTFRIPLIND